ncbi:MAG: POTRA domain-containing protein [Pyrinomonadaceae bacterium]
MVPDKRVYNIFKRRISPKFFDPYWLASSRLLILCAFLPVFCISVLSQSEYENREVANVTVTFEGADRNVSVSEQFRLIAREAVGSKYSAVKIRDAIQQLYRTNRIATISVEALPSGENRVIVRFIIKRKTQAQTVNIEIIGGDDTKVTEQELLFKLNLLEAGTAITEQTLRNSATLIQEYLRERGFFRAEVSYSQTPLDNPTEVAVTFRVTPNAPATVGTFNINIEGFDKAKFAGELKLEPGKPYSRELLTQDVEKVREILRKDGFLAPFLNEPRPVYDSEKNIINIELGGTKGPTVEVSVEAKGERGEESDGVGEGTQNRLFPVRREGTLDYSAIIEGERRLENYYQERGFFFVDATPFCSVVPPLLEGDATAIRNDTEFLCSALNSADLSDKKVLLNYRVNLGRQLKLADIRIEGTDEFTISEIKTVLDSKEANILGIIPLFGYGRGYTSERLLEEDASTIRSLLRELGYREAQVRANQGVSPDGENLIITFVVEEGTPTIISDVQINGNIEFSDAVLMAQLPALVGKNFSRAKIRNGQRKLSEFYSQAGYFDAVVDFSIDERTVDPVTGEKLFKIVYQVKHRPNPLSAETITATETGPLPAGEGKKVYIGRILVTGNENTKSEAIQRALTLRSEEVLRARDIYTSEQNLYASDVFSRVEIKRQPVGETKDGRLADLIVNVEEQASRILSYGGGYSTDVGASGFVDIRHLNLFGRLWQGGARIRVSQRQQLAQLDYFNPRFIRDGEKRFAPLTITAQYQRDSTVTRFFRSAFDRGTFGIVQRLDENGNPIDEFGADVGSPTLNRLLLTAETNRTISLRNRSILFFRYRFEDVRLFNIQSLLIRDLLVPDSRIRISGFGATFVRDTRQDCSIKYSILDIIARGEAGEPCRYSAGDPTNGDYLTAEYNVSLPFLGANIGFHKFQASYNKYYTVRALKNTTFAGRAILGLANVFSSGNRFSSTQFPDLEGILPISERFFAGGPNTLRGFDFESAGPRIVVVPQGTFRNRNGDPVTLDPFTIPFGGNALAVVNLEARIPITELVRAVPFYDGGNVFRRVGDIFNPPDAPPNDVFRQNLRVLWSHTIGLGLRIKTPIGGEFGIDYGYLLNPPRFLIPQVSGPNAIFQLPQSQIHFRFSQAF